MPSSLLTVVETSAFTRRAETLLSAEEYEDLIYYLARYRDAGDEIPGTGGVRKLRFAARSKGKSGGVRVIYYFFDQENPLYALLVFGKNEQTDMSSEQKKWATAFVATIKGAAKSRRRLQ